jgi:hypothetical protein
MGTGRYALRLNFNGSTPPTEPSSIVAVPDGNPLHSGGGEADGPTGAGPYVGAIPVISAIAPANGPVRSDGVTNCPNISLLGAAPANETITLYCNGNLIGSTTSQGNNTWTYNNTATTVRNGIYFFTATATDPSGYTTPFSYPHLVLIDTHTPSPPVLNAISPGTGGITNVKNLTFSGTSEPLDTINLRSNGNNQPFATTNADLFGNWSYTLPGGGWGDSTYSVTAMATDLAGTTSGSSSTLKVVIDTQQPQPPQVTGISPDTGKNNDGITTAKNLTFSGTAQPALAVSVYLNGTLLGVITAGTTGAWTFDNTAMTLANGSYTITARASDIAGNVSNVSNAFQLAVETVNPPVITAISPNAAGSGQQSLSIAGTVAPNDSVQVSLNGSLLGTVNANGQGSWSYNYVPSSTQVSSGIYSVSGVAVDQSANVSAPSTAFQLQVGGSGAPTAATPQYAAGTLSGQATPGSLVTIVDGNVVLGTVTADASGNWHFTPTLSQGGHNIMVEATNSLGYTSLLSGALNLNV